MPALPLAGPSSQLRSGVEVRRCINWEPVLVESGSGKGGVRANLKQVAGLKLVADLGAEGRALKVARGRLFAVNENHLVEVSPAGAATVRGTLPTGFEVAAADNETQLGLAVGLRGFAFDLDANTLTEILTNWPGSSTLNVLDGHGILTPDGTNKFYITKVEDFTVIDALDFASAESSPGNIVSALVKHRQLVLLKERGGEVWYDSGENPDFAFARDESAVIETGSAARKSLCKIGGVAYWLGRDEEGTAIFFAMGGYQPQRVSSDALEEKLATLTDLSGATAWAYHQEGQSRIVLNVPGLDTTWVYNIAAGLWHERGDWVDGAWTPWRARFHAFAYGKHYVLDTEGNLYELLPTWNRNGSDVLRRLWRSPHNATPQADMQTFGSFEVVCDTGRGLPSGAAPSMPMRYSNDGAQNWQDWIELSLGAIGETQTRARETGLGSATDRVWEFVVTDDVQCNPSSVLVNEQ